MPVKFRRYGNQAVDIANYVKDKQCNCRGPFHHCRNTDLIHVLKGCKCDHGRMMQMSTPCACVDLRVLDSNILNDPGFEIYSIIPEDTNLPTPRIIGGWVQGPGAISPEEKWEVESVSPESGTFHARAALTAGNFDKGTGYIQPLEAWDCVWGSPYSAVVAPGDFVQFSIRAKASQIASANPSNDMYMQWLDVDIGTLGYTSITTTAFTTSYATYTKSAIAPAGVTFVRATFQPKCIGTLGVDTNFDIDNGILEVA